MRRFKIWANRVLVLIILFGIGGLLSKLFGPDNEITIWYRENILFTVYNIVGIIMVLLAMCGIWVGTRKGSKMFKAVSTIALVVSIVPIIVSIISIVVPKDVAIGVSEHMTNMLNSLKIVLIATGSLIALLVLIWIIVKLVNFFKLNIRERRYKGQNSRFSYVQANEPKAQDLVSKQNETQKFIIEIAHKETSNISNEKLLEEEINKTNEANNSTLEESLNKNDYLEKIVANICPMCGGRLKSHQNHKTNKWFMGCENYFTSQQCRFTIDYAEYKLLKNK